MSATAFQRMRREKKVKELTKKQIELKSKVEKEHFERGKNEVLERAQRQKNTLLNTNLHDLKTDELKKLAKEKGLEGYSNLNKSKLLEALKE